MGVKKPWAGVGPVRRALPIIGRRGIKINSLETRRRTVPLNRRHPTGYTRKHEMTLTQSSRPH